MKNLFKLLVLFVAFTSCRQKVLDISSVTLRSRLVVNALINNQDQISISVSTSTVIQDSVRPPALQKAKVIIKDGAGVETVCAYNLVTDKYECAIIPKPGEFYSVKVSAPGFSDAFADLIIPEVATSGKSTWKDSTGSDSSGFMTGTISVKLNDNAANHNYYRISLFYFINGSQTWRVLEPILADAQLDQQAIKVADGGVVFDDLTFNGKSKNIDFITPFGMGQTTPKFLVVIENLSENYYRYFKSLDDYKDASNGVFSEPAQVFSNITNGLGIFAASSLQRDTIQ